MKQNHNKLNFAISYAALKCLGLDSNKIIKSLIKFSGLPHRMEYVGSLNNIYFYQQFMREIQKNIKNGTFQSFYKKYINLFD